MSVLEKAAVVVPTYEGDFVLQEDLLLECGRTLVRPVLHYAVYGRLNEARSNAVLVCHALSGSALVGGWWPELFGDESKSAGDRIGELAGDGEDGGVRSATGIVDLSRDCVVCVNLLGSCYGSTGPGSLDPETGSVYGRNFPLVSIRDNVRAQAQLLDSLCIAKIPLAIGGSIGAMQALEWTILYPERVERAVVIAVAPLNAMGLALNHLQRQAIVDDPDWQGGNYTAGQQTGEGGNSFKGLALARRIAMLSYKSPVLFAERFGRNPNRNGEDPWGLGNDGEGLIGGRFDVGGFLDYQGRRFLERFDANSYLAILRMMDTWDPARGYRTAEEAYGRILARLTFVGISSDWLFPPGDVQILAKTIQAAGVAAEYCEMKTDHGHDAFLAEQVELVRLLNLAE